MLSASQFVTDQDNNFEKKFPWCTALHTKGV